MTGLSKNLMNILNEIEKKTSFDARLYRQSTLKRRVAYRMRMTQTKNYKEYFAYLIKNPSEYDKFLDSFTINVTEFFRDRRIFSTLRIKILPELINRKSVKGHKRIRIWSIGCSKGQEPYSLAILFKDVLKNRWTDFRVIIQATDVNDSVLKKAKAGLYDKEEMKNIPRPYLNDYFEKNGDRFKIKEDIRKMVKFKKHDIIKNNSLGKFDIIFCRNLFIFFEIELQDKILEKIYDSLNKDGILVLGKAEKVNNKESFQCLSIQDHIYKKVT